MMLRMVSLSHVLKLYLGVSRGMLPVKSLPCNISFIMAIKFNGDSKTVTSGGLSGGKQWHAPCEKPALQYILYYGNQVLRRLIRLLQVVLNLVSFVY